MPRLLIKNGLVIDPASGLEARRDLLLENGRISRLAPKIPVPAGCETFDAAGLWVFPGFIDLHVHAREPGAEAAETLASAARAAAAGGVTSLLLMPNTSPPMAKPALLKKYAARARALPVNMYFSAAITADRSGRKLADLAGLKKAGARAFTDDGSCVEDGLLLRRAVRAAARLGLPLLDHPELARFSAGGVINRRLSGRDLPAIGDEAEVFAVLRDILAAADCGPVHLQHLSLAASVSLLRAAKAAGLPVTGETCPHYFTLSDRDADPRDADFKMKPPLRRPADRAAVLAALADGTIDAIATDHAPHERRLKTKGFLAAPFGVIGLETLAALCFTELALKKGLSKTRLARLLSANPARLLGLRRKGALAPGFDADITILDPRAAKRVPEKFFSLSANSPFKGRLLKGWPAAVLAGGRFVFRDGRVFC
ncbi:MAG TPA: dihydroorotase [Elusimicrobiales bacterium]|nr:dihydroorotase [Elusimicrobiales bacterium]